MSSGDPTGQAGSERKQSNSFFQSYSHFSRLLRVWFVAFGVGGLVTIFSDKDVRDTLLCREEGRYVVWLFLAGTAVQVVNALLYKSAMWHLYVGEEKESHRDKWYYKAADWISESFALEISLDLATAILLASAVVLVCCVFT